MTDNSFNKWLKYSGETPKKAAEDPYGQDPPATHPGLEKWAKYEQYARPGEIAGRPKQERGVGVFERIALQNVGDAPEQKADWLRRRGYEATAQPSGQVSVRKEGARDWGVIDPSHGDIMDPLDIGDELLFGVATATGGTAGLAAGGPVVGALGAAGGGAVAESIKKGAAAALGFRENPMDVLKDVAVSGAIGGVVDPLLRGAGGLMKAGARKLRSKIKAPAPGAAVPEPAPTGGIPRPGLPPARDVKPVPEVPPAPGAPLPEAAPNTLSPKAPTVRHTVTAEEGGGVKTTMEQVFRPSESVKPHLSAAEAQTLNPGTASKVVDLVDPAPGEAVYITFLKKAKKLTKKQQAAGEVPPAQEVRTMRVHGNARHPTWLSEAEIAKHPYTKEMPTSMLRELVAEHMPVPGIIKKTYGTDNPDLLGRDGLVKWLFEKQPGVVTGRIGPPGTRAAENRAHQLIQFWEQFSEHTPSVGKTTAKGKYQKSSLELGEEGILRNVIPGTKEHGGYRHFGEKNVLELRVGDKVYHFNPEGAPKQIAGAKKIAGAPGVEKTTPLAEAAVPPAPKTPKKPRRSSGIGQAVRAAATLAHPTARGSWNLAVNIAKTYTPNAYKLAGAVVNKVLSTVKRTLEKHGREAAQAVAYAQAQKHKEFRMWLEKQEE